MENLLPNSRCRNARFICTHPVAEAFGFVPVTVCYAIRGKARSSNLAPSRPIQRRCVRRRCLRTAGGALWVGTSAGGLFRYDGTNIERIDTSHRRIRAIIEDRENNIWVGTDGGGLDRLRKQVVEVQGKDAGMPFDTVRSVCEDATDTIWVITQNGDVVNNSGGSWKTISSSSAWTGGVATCVACDRQGIVWIGTFSHGLYRWQDGKFTGLRRADGLAQASIRSLLADSRGNLWIAFSVGDILQCLRDGQFKILICHRTAVPFVRSPKMWRATSGWRISICACSVFRGTK